MHICSVPIAQRVYDLQVIHGRLYFNGREHLSVTDHDKEAIYISDTIPLDDRPRVVATAVALAWQHLTRGMPTLPLLYDVDREDGNLSDP